MLTERQFDILRLVDAGVPLRAEPGSAGTFDFAGISPTVRRTTLRQLEAEGFLAFDQDRHCYRLTESGRERIRVRDTVKDFAHQLETA